MAQNNEQIMRRYIQEVLNAGNMNAFEELVAPNFSGQADTTAQKLGLSVTGTGRDGAKQGIQQLRQMVPDLHYDIDNITSQGDSVTVQGTVRGKPAGKLMGKGAGNKQVAVKYTATARIENGKIVGGSSQWDADELSRQLGS